MSKLRTSLIRFLDFVLAGLGLLVVLPLLTLLCVLSWLDIGSPLFRQTRIGYLRRPFVILKISTMKLGTASVPTHLSRLEDITKFGFWLRKNKLDELPQLWNVLMGDMSLVGPRPGLVNHVELTSFRDGLGVFDVRPGITGLAQLKGIDMSNPELLAQTDMQMLKNMNLKNYFKYIYLTVIGEKNRNRILK